MARNVTTQDKYVKKASRTRGLGLAGNVPLLRAAALDCVREDLDDAYLHRLMEDASASRGPGAGLDLDPQPDLHLAMVGKGSAESRRQGEAHSAPVVDLRGAPTKARFVAPSFARPDQGRLHRKAGGGGSRHPHPDSGNDVAGDSLWSKGRRARNHPQAAPLLLSPRLGIAGGCTTSRGLRRGNAAAVNFGSAWRLRGFGLFFRLFDQRFGDRYGVGRFGDVRAAAVSGLPGEDEVG
jgi:hypothetical protein